MTFNKLITSSRLIYQAMCDTQHDKRCVWCSDMLSSIGGVHAWQQYPKHAVLHTTHTFVRQLGGTHATHGWKHVEIIGPIHTVDYCGFYKCMSTSIQLPASTTSIQAYGFAQSIRLKHFCGPPLLREVCSYAFANCVSLVCIHLEHVVSIGEKCMSGCTHLAHAKFGNTLTLIGKEAFAGCTRLKSVDAGSSLRVIGSEAFYGCSQLCEFHTGDNLVELGTRAFARCSSLRCVTLGPSLVALPAKVFFMCHNLQAIHIPTGIREIKQDAFNQCANIHTVVFPSTVSTICAGAFGKCGNLHHVRLPNDLETIDMVAFEGCRKLEIISWPRKLRLVGIRAFANSGVTTFTPTSRVYIQPCAFEHSDLQYVKLPKSLTRVPFRAFTNCDKLCHVDLPTTLSTIDADAFYGCVTLTSIIVPLTCRIVADTAFQAHTRVTIALQHG